VSFRVTSYSLTLRVLDPSRSPNCWAKLASELEALDNPLRWLRLGHWAAEVVRWRIEQGRVPPVLAPSMIYGPKVQCGVSAT